MVTKMKRGTILEDDHFLLSEMQYEVLNQNHNRETATAAIEGQHQCAPAKRWTLLLVPASNSINGTAVTRLSALRGNLWETCGAFSGRQD